VATSRRLSLGRAAGGHWGNKTSITYYSARLARLKGVVS
jgi:hypothetical protein